MGQDISRVVFQPPPASYDENLPNLVYIPSDLHENHKIPAVYLEWQPEVKESGSLVNDTSSNDSSSSNQANEGAYFTLLYCNSNTSDLGQIQTWLKLLRDTLHLNIVAFDFTGYGLNRVKDSHPINETIPTHPTTSESSSTSVTTNTTSAETGTGTTGTEGETTEKSCYEEIKSVFKWLVCDKKIDSERIILMGKSLGSGPVVHLAASLSSARTGAKASGRIGQEMYNYGCKILKEILQQTKNTNAGGLGGIILQSPLTSVLDVDGSKFHMGAPDMFNNYRKVNQHSLFFLFLYSFYLIL